MAMAVSLSLSSPSSALFQSRHSFAKCLASKQNSPLQLEQTKSRDRNPITLHSFSPFPLFCAAALLPGGEAVGSVFGPFVDLVKSWNLPDWLVHWGHPANMAVVLIAMGGYGTYLGFRIRYSENVEEKAKAKDLHPKLLAGMFFFFALGATGGITALLTSDKPIFESPHAVTGVIGLALLTIQTVLPSLFEEIIHTRCRKDQQPHLEGLSNRRRRKVRRPASENFPSPEELLHSSFETSVQNIKEMADQPPPRRTLRDASNMVGPMNFNNIALPVDNATNMVMNPALIQLVQSNRFHGMLNENPMII